MAVISDGLWEREFGRSPAVLGQTITVNQSVLTIVGVNPRGFTGAKNVQTVAGCVCAAEHAAGGRSHGDKRSLLVAAG